MSLLCTHLKLWFSVVRCSFKWVQNVILWHLESPSQLLLSMSTYVHASFKLTRHFFCFSYFRMRIGCRTWAMMPQFSTNITRIIFRSWRQKKRNLWFSRWNWQVCTRNTRWKFRMWVNIKPSYIHKHSHISVSIVNSNVICVKNLSNYELL